MLDNIKKQETKNKETENKQKNPDARYNSMLGGFSTVGGQVGRPAPSGCRGGGGG